jgi:DNA polymerase III sliding clamp (beta) subunit (PCNA family)
MKGSFTAQARALVPAVKYVAKWLDTKPSNPVFGGIVFDVADGALTIGSQSELATARAVLTVEGDAVGRFIVSGRLVDALVATLTDKPVTFDQDGSAVSMSAGRYQATLPTMSESDYPDLATLAPSVGRIEGAALIDAVRRVGAMASRDTDKISLSGIRFHFKSDPQQESGEFAYTLEMDGTDSLHATRETVEWTPDEDAEIGGAFILPASVLIDAGDAFAGLNVVEIGWSEGTVSLATHARSLVTRTFGKAGDFPDMGVLFDQLSKRTHTATLAVSDMVGPLKRADQLADGEHRHITLDLRTNSVTLRSATEGKGGGGEEVDIEYDGPDCSIITRSAILHGLLATVPGDTVTLHLTPRSYLSVFATSPTNPAWTHLWMPIRHT